MGSLKYLTMSFMSCLTEEMPRKDALRFRLNGNQNNVVLCYE